MPVTAVDTKADFDAKVREAGGKLVVVDFYADWCGPCRQIAPKIEAMSEEFSNVVFLKVNVDENEETSEHFGIQAMPTFKFIKNGTEISDSAILGANEAKLREHIAKYK